MNLIEVLTPQEREEDVEEKDIIFYVKVEGKVVYGKEKGESSPHLPLPQHGEDGRATNFCDLCGLDYDNAVHLTKTTEGER